MMQPPIPFSIGDVKWLPVTTKCPVCFGKLFCTVILGNDERVQVPCEACGKGYDGPRGTIQEHNYTPEARKFTIASIASMHMGRWCINSEEGGYAEFSDLCATEEDALAQSAAKCAEAHERNMESRATHRKQTKEHTWSIKYHRKEIADCERRIEWHRSKIEARAQK
jgi:hypothetical protein